MPDALMTDGNAINNRFERIFRSDPDVVRHAVRVSVWGRWFIWISGVGLLAYRPDFWYPDLISFLYLNVALAAINGVVHHRLLSHREVTWRWMLGLSAIDLALITANVAASGRFDNFHFILYYPALAIFAVVFTSFRVNLTWTTAAAAALVVVSLVTGSGLDMDAGDDKRLFAKVVVMYLMVVGISLVLRFERTRRLAAMANEQRAQRDRNALSQSIHDTAAQTAYMIGLGIEGAMKAAGDANPELAEKLAATAALSRSAMWELRRPIDMGHIFEGRDLANVLGGHTATFSKITSVPAEMVRSGEEPPLAPEVRTGLFSIAHNALTNAFMHAQAGRIEVRLDFEPDLVRLSVSDDGVGLPGDYSERGHGFSGMRQDAKRMGGWLTVESGKGGRGTSITCVVHLEPNHRGD